MTDQEAYPDHDSELNSLARIEGQVRGIRRMIEKRRYCVDILTQTRAVHAALRRVERNILREYIETCVQQSFVDGSSDEQSDKVREILNLFDWGNGK